MLSCIIITCVLNILQFPSSLIHLPSLTLTPTLASTHPTSICLLTHSLNYPTPTNPYPPSISTPPHPLMFFPPPPSLTPHFSAPTSSFHTHLFFQIHFYHTHLTFSSLITSFLYTKLSLLHVPVDSFFLSTLTYPLHTTPLLAHFSSYPLTFPLHTSPLLHTTSPLGPYHPISTSHHSAPFLHLS